MHVENKQLISQKLTQAIGILQELNIDAWLTFVRETSLAPDPALELIYDGDLTGQSAILLTQTGEKVAIAAGFDTPNLLELGVYTEVIGYHEGIQEPLVALLKRVNPQSLAINYSEADVAADGLSLGMYRTLLRYLDGTGFAERLISAEKIIFHLRGRKSPTEIDRIQQAVLTTEKLFDELEQFVKPGMTQHEIATFLQNRIDGLGLDYAWPKPYNPIVTCGPDSAVGHVIPGNVVLQKGHLLHIDLGVRENSYSSDLQRMWYVLDSGEKDAPPDVQRAFDVVAGAIKAGETLLQPGTPGWKVDEAARDFIIDHGYPEYKHALGHMLGRVAHDGGTLLAPQWEIYSKSCKHLVEVNNVFTLELHVVVEGRGIMSLEEDIVVTEEGVTYLSKPQESLRIIHS